MKPRASSAYYQVLLSHENVVASDMSRMATLESPRVDCILCSTRGQSVRGAWLAVVNDVGSQGSAKPITFDLVTKEVARNCSHKRIIPLTFELAAFH